MNKLFFSCWYEERVLGGQCTQDSISRSGYTPTNQPAHNKIAMRTRHQIIFHSAQTSFGEPCTLSSLFPHERRMRSNRLIFWWDDGTSDLLWYQVISPDRVVGLWLALPNVVHAMCNAPFYKLCNLVWRGREYKTLWLRANFVFNHKKSPGIMAHMPYRADPQALFQTTQRRRALEEAWPLLQLLRYWTGLISPPDGISSHLPSYCAKMANLQWNK